MKLKITLILLVHIGDMISMEMDYILKIQLLKNLDMNYES